MDIKELRALIDELDEELVLLVKARLDLVKKVALVKKELDLPVVDETRVSEVISGLRGLASSLGVSPVLVEDLISRIFEESNRLQSDLLKK